MSAARAVWRIARAAVHVGHGTLIVATRFPRLDAAGRMQRVQWWSAKYLRLLGIAVRASGTPLPGPVLIVANHVSWVDILALNAVRPARFVSKAQVRHWPLLGWLVSAAGTLYIERERARDAMRVVHQMAQALTEGDVLAVFPEGTTSDGHAVLPFHANLLQAAVASQTPVQAAVLRYSDARHAVSPAAAYVGDTTLLQSLWAIVSAQGLCVHVRLLDARAAAGSDRRALSAQLRADIERALAGEAAAG